MGAITETEPDAGETRPAGRGGLRPFLDPLLVLCALALIAFPVACVLAASRAPLDPRPPPPRVPAGPSGPAVRTVPVLAARPALDDPAGIRRLVEARIVSDFQRADAARLRRYLNGPALPPPPGMANTDYPYHYRGFDALLDRHPADPELGALLIAAAAGKAYPNAGQAAFAVLHRAAAGGGCAPQLN